MSDVVYKGDVCDDLCLTIDSVKVFPQSSSFDIRFLHRCPRQQVLHTRSNGVKVDLNSILHEKSVKSKWFEIFKSCKNVRVVDHNVIVCDAKCNITATLDVVIEFKDEIYVVNVVPLEYDIFNKVVKNGPMRKDVITVQAYIWLSEIDDAILIYEDKRNQTYEMFFVRKDTPMINAIESNLINLSKHQISGSVPDIPSEIKQSECNACEYKLECDRIELTRRKKND